MATSVKTSRQDIQLGNIFPIDETRTELVQYIQSEMDSCESSKEERTSRIDKWRRASQCEPAEKKKTFPWDGASNIVTAMTMTDVNGMTSALKAAYADKKPFFHTHAINPAYNKHAEAMTKYMSLLVESKFHLNLRQLLNEMFYEVAMIGTKVAAVAWDVDVSTFKRKGSQGETEVVNIVRHKGPKIVPIRDEGFYIPPYAEDLQSSPWIAAIHNLTFPELKTRERQGIYYNIDSIKPYAVNISSENAERDLSRAGVSIGSTTELYRIVEAYAFWDAEDDGTIVDVKIWFERTSGIVIREEFNDLGVRNISAGNYFKLPGQFYGMGIGWICENPQDAVDALTNMAINSTHISSLQGFVTKRGSGIGPKFKFKPLFQLELDSPRDDFQAVVFPNTIGPNMALAGQMRNDADRAVGANNALLGFPDTVAKTRSTASGYMFQAQQSSRSFNSVVENMDSWLGEIAMLIMFQLINHKDDVNTDIIGTEDGKLVREVLDMKIEDVHLNFGFSITSTEIEQTEEARRQAILTLTQLYSMYGQKMLGLVQGDLQISMQLMQQMPQLGPMVQKSVGQYFEMSNQFKVGSTKLMQYLLDYFDIEQKGYLPYTKDIEMMLEFMNAMKDVQIGGMQNGQLPGNSGQPRSIGSGTQDLGGPVGGPGAQGGVNQPNSPDNGAGSGSTGSGSGGGAPGGFGV
jgi:hypothetical protein